MQVQWEYQSDGTAFQRYRPEINAKIEAAYLRDSKGSVEWEEEKGLYRIDFSRMIVSAGGQSDGNSKSVQRIIAGTVESLGIFGCARSLS